MELQAKPVEVLVQNVLAELTALRYAKSSITNYKCFYNRVIRYARERGDIYYSEELGSDFLQQFYQCNIDTVRDTAPSKRLRTQIRYIRVLGDYQLHGIIFRRKLGKLATTPCPSQFVDGYDAFVRDCKARNYSEQGSYSRLNRIKNFLFYMDDHGINSYECITPSNVSDYFKTCISLNSKSVKAIISAVKNFFLFLYLNEFMHNDLSDKLPKLKDYYAPSIPCVWTPEDVKLVLDTIDRGNPTGKRDYAMLLIITRLGLRASDIKAMKLENLRWDTNTLEIVQSKTKNPVVYPMLSDIGWAIIDYLKSGRPITDSPYVFVRHNAPFEAFAPNAAMNRILVSYIRKAGVKIPRVVPLGLHSLRHTLASILLEQDTPLPLISNILGHMSIKSTDVYLHIDFKRLHECALDPEAVFDYAK